MKVKELSDEEISCIITGLQTLHKNDKDYMFYNIIDDLYYKIKEKRLFVEV